MGEISILITDMVKSGVDPELIGRTAELLAAKARNENVTKNVTKRPLSNAERQAKYRKKQRNSNEM